MLSQLREASRAGAVEAEIERGAESGEERGAYIEVRCHAHHAVQGKAVEQSRRGEQSQEPKSVTVTDMLFFMTAVSLM